MWPGSSGSRRAGMSMILRSVAGSIDEFASTVKRETWLKKLDGSLLFGRSGA